MKQNLRFAGVCIAGLLTVTAPRVDALNKSTSSLPRFLVGAFPAPPMGPGPGKLAVVPVQKGAPYALDFGTAGKQSGNSFYVAEAGDLVFVPSISGTTEVLSIRTGKPVRQFNSIAGGRVAAVSADHSLIFVLSAKSVVAYAANNGKIQFQVPFGGNALSFNADGSRLYVGGNMDNSIAEIDPSSGRILRQIPIGHSGDLAWAGGFLFSADIQSGVMTAYNPVTNRTYPMPTPEVDPNFTYSKIPSATAGFMQLAVSRDQQYVYAAGFSGHILRFSSRKPAYLGQVSVSIDGRGPNKLSGLTVLPDGATAITTVENRNESVIVDLDSGKITKRLPGIASNRWISADFVSASGVVEMPSDHSFSQTVLRLKTAIRKRHLQVAAVVDHGAAARKVGLSLRPTELVIFGNPVVGTKLMQVNRQAGLDLPLKVLVWEDAQNRVRLDYVDPAVIAGRYGIDPDSKPIRMMTRVLDAVAHDAAGS